MNFSQRKIGADQVFQQSSRFHNSGDEQNRASAAKSGAFAPASTAKLCQRLLAKLDAGEGARFLSQYRYYLKRLEETLAHASLRLVDLEGTAYDPGIAAAALNAGDCEADDSLLVDQMVEPIIMGPDGLVRAGTVMLRRVNS